MIHGSFVKRSLDFKIRKCLRLKSFKGSNNNATCVVVFQLLSCVQLFVIAWTAEHQASLSTVSRSLLKCMSIESVMLPNHLILCCLLLLPSILPSIRVFSNGQFFALSGQSIRASPSASVLPSGLTCLISLLSNRLSRVFSYTTV